MEEIYSFEEYIEFILEYGKLQQFYNFITGSCRIIEIRR